MGHLHSVANTAELRAVYQKVLPKIVNVSLRLGQKSEDIFCLKKLRSSQSWEGLSLAQKRAVEQRIKDAEHSGVGLADESKSRFNSVSQKLSDLQTQFSNNVLDATKAFSLCINDAKDMQGMPESYLSLSSQNYLQHNPNETSDPQKGPWLITLDAPSFTPFL